MKGGSRGLVTLGFISIFLASGPRSAAAPRAALSDMPRVTLDVSDQGGIDRQTFERARKVVDAILEKGGVRADWVDCSALEEPRRMDCLRPERPGVIPVRFVRRNRAVVAWSGELTYAVALRPEGPGGDGLITIFYDRVEVSAERRKLSRGLVLGHVLAHELGHLLLPDARHSDQGIMRAQFGEGEWQLAQQGNLQFTRQQAKEIRQGLRKRLEGPQPQEAANSVSLSRAALTDGPK